MIGDGFPGRLVAALSRGIATPIALLLATTMAAAQPKPAPAPNGPPRQMVATAHSLATEAGLATLRRGGNAVDAMVAVQLVLGVVEPQSSGIGGGSLLLYWDAAARKLTSVDGLSRAPGSVDTGLAVDESGKPLSDAERRAVARSGRAIGVPGTMRLLHDVHRGRGKLAWDVLFQPAIAVAREGFAMPPYLFRTLTQATFASDATAVPASFFGTDRKPLPVGTVIRNPALADTLERLAREGVAPLYEGDIGAAIVAAATAGPLPGRMTAADLAGYRTVERAPVCAPFRDRTVCAMPPPSFGGVGVLQVLGMVARHANGPVAFDQPRSVHVYVEAMRLASADRLGWIGDPNHVDVPTAGLVDARYLGDRAGLIRYDARIVRASPGHPDDRHADKVDLACTPPPPSTSQVAIVDRDGNALSLTTTLNLNFGSHATAAGFGLNNVMTNFARAPRGGLTSPNAMAGDRRPVTSMAPTIVLGRDGRPEIVGGSAGGGEIVGYIAQSLLDMLANGRTPQQAIDTPHVAVMCDQVGLEKGTAAAALKPALEALGHGVVERPLNSRLQFLRRSGNGWIGGADARRDGVVGGF